MKRRTFIKTAGVFAGAGVLGGLSFPAIGQQPIRLKFESYVTETAGPSWIDRWFLDQLEERTDGAVDVSRYWASSLNRVGEHLPAVRDRTIDITLISPGYYQADVPVTRGLEWYFRMQRADSLLDVCRDVYEEFDPLRAEWEDRHNAKVLYWTNWNYAPMITREEVNSAKDLEGLRIRGYGVANDVIERLGGTGVPMAAPEVYTALERGVLDGVYGFDFITGISYKLHEIAPHFTNIGDGPHAPSAIVINTQVWESFPDEVKAVCNELVQEIYDEQYSKIMTEVLADYTDKALDEGVQFNIWSDQAQAEAKEIVQPAQVQHWIETIAKSNNIDGEKMQEVIARAIERHDGSGVLLRPEEIAAQKNS